MKLIKKYLVVAVAFGITNIAANAPQMIDQKSIAIAFSAHAGAEQITAEELKAYDEFLASDELEGRDTPSRGLNIAANFIAANLAAWKLKPLGDDGTYFQHLSLERDLIDGAQTQVEIGGGRYLPGDDFIPLTAEGNASGQLVYAGDGWLTADSNPYKDIDIRDKIVVIMDGGPKGGYTDLFSDHTENPYEYAETHGAKALIIVPNLGLQRWGLDRLRQRAFEIGDICVPALTIPRSVPFNVGTTGGVADIDIKEGLRIPMITALPALVNALFSGEKLSPAKIFRNGTGHPGEPFTLNPEKKVSISVKLKSEKAMAQNVVALLEGTDPQLKKEYVVIGAHYDHLGMRPPERGEQNDRIYHGADDNGSGDAALLGIARAFALAPRPKRSILFVWYTGEERGEWGSKFITQFPPISLDATIAQLNMDMVGRTKKEGDTNPQDAELTGPHEVYACGSKFLSSELGEISEAVNNGFLKLKLNYQCDDVDHQSVLLRSDDDSYLQKGIPVIAYYTGFHADYHTTSDTSDKIDPQKMEDIARTVYATARALASVPHRPKVDKSLPAALKEK